MEAQRDKRCQASARRARALPQEYASKARKLDRMFCGASADEPGPVERKLRAYDPVRGLAFGSWVEGSPGSPDVDRLINVLAETGAQRHWRAMRAGSATEAKGAPGLAAEAPLGAHGPPGKRPFDA